MKISTVDQFLISGCGRCKHFDTPQCKVHTWSEALHLLRGIMQNSGLTEEIKWGFPCYSNSENKNILMIGAFKEFCSLSFFKGVLLTDSHQLLQKAGENSQTMRLLKFTSPEQVIQQSSIINQYITEAIEIEKSGIKIQKPSAQELVLCTELATILDEMPELKVAFQKLTPGRQRGYNLYFSDAKQSATRISRIEKFIPKILSGKGFQD
ncbi:MAG: hypothetical protein EBR94_08390 [Bacteroidetes bacterium]|jgi:uncharacterized protein YdeI (YjbR/CyaY-like superfamily)|nr:hypothetical protein [Bacteroidota bacterium]